MFHSFSCQNVLCCHSYLYERAPVQGTAGLQGFCVRLNDALVVDSLKFSLQKRMVIHKTFGRGFQTRSRCTKSVCVEMPESELLKTEISSMIFASTQSFLGWTDVMQF